MKNTSNDQGPFVTLPKEENLNQAQDEKKNPALARSILKEVDYIDAGYGI